MYGWIKLHRQIQESPMYRQMTSKQRDVLINLLLMASHKENEWIFKGKIQKIKPGQFITSLDGIKEKCASDVSIQNIRTCLLKLENYGFLTNEPTNKNRLITIVNWGLYQSVDDESTSESTDNQQPDNSQLTTIKNVKNLKNEKNKDKKTSSRQRRTYAEDSSPYRMAVYLHNRIMEHAEEIGKGHLVRDADLQKWADSCRKILELDKRGREEVRQVIEWATADNFWQQNILSPDALRKNFVRLCLEMERGKQDGFSRENGKRAGEGAQRKSEYAHLDKSIWNPEGV